MDRSEPALWKRCQHAYSHMFLLLPGKWHSESHVQKSVQLEQGTHIPNMTCSIFYLFYMVKSGRCVSKILHEKVTVGKVVKV